MTAPVRECQPEAAALRQHTPTPWTYSANSFGTQFIYGDLKTPKRSPMGVTYFHLVAGGDHYATLTQDNAAFIVEAVNRYAAMKEALEWYAKDYDHVLGCSQWDGGAKARAALAPSLERQKTHD